MSILFEAEITAVEVEFPTAPWHRPECLVEGFPYTVPALSS